MKHFVGKSPITIDLQSLLRKLLFFGINVVFGGFPDTS